MTPDETRPQGPLDATVVPRFAGPATFARLPRIEDVAGYDIAVVGVPFDAGVTYRPGARFGPAHARQCSRLLRPYNPALEVSPFARAQIVDAGDIACNPFDIHTALGEITAGAAALIGAGQSLVAIGGDHTVALALLRATAAVHGPVALVHFDAHLDTWDTYFGHDYTHGTPFRRAWEEGLLLEGHCAHVGIRGPLYGEDDLASDARLGFTVIRTTDFDEMGVPAIIAALEQRVGAAPLYLSIDVDVLDPSAVPATGTPEAGGLSSRELLRLLRGLRNLNLVGGDVVELAPAYDHAEISGIAAATVVYELVSLLALARPARP